MWLSHSRFWFLQSSQYRIDLLHCTTQNIPQVSSNPTRKTGPKKYYLCLACSLFVCYIERDTSLKKTHFVDFHPLSCCMPLYWVQTCTLKVPNPTKGESWLSIVLPGEQHKCLHLERGEPKDTVQPALINFLFSLKCCSLTSVGQMFFIATKN